MSNAYEEILKFADSYRGIDYLEKNKEVFLKYREELDENEKKELAKHFCLMGSTPRFCAFVEIIGLELHLGESVQYMAAIFEGHKSDYIFSKENANEGIDFIVSRIPEKEYDTVLSEALILSIKYRNILVVQNLMERGAKTDYTNENNESVQSLISIMKDKTLAEYVQYYILNGKIKEDCSVYFKQGIYTPEFYEDDADYFATKGLEACKEILESYGKSRLLSKRTSLKQLNEFIDAYNWDDGVEVPYFIMHHPNCDLNLKKKIFKLGAGDCIEADTYVNTRKDPWKQFILELDEMIKEEEGK